MNRHSMPLCISRWKLGPDGSHWGAAAPLVCLHPGGLASWPPSCGCFLGEPRPLPRWCSAQIQCVGGLLHLFPLRISALRFLVCAFCSVLFIFHLYSNVCPAKHVFSNISGTMSIVKVYVSKDCLFLLFWTLFGVTPKNFICKLVIKFEHLFDFLCILT